MDTLFLQMMNALSYGFLLLLSHVVLPLSLEFLVC
jgi:hypothetical protein